MSMYNGIISILILRQCNQNIRNQANCIHKTKIADEFIMGCLEYYSHNFLLQSQTAIFANCVI